MKDQDHLKVAKAAGEFYDAIKRQEKGQAEVNYTKSTTTTKNPFITPSIIFAVGIIIAAFLYAYAHRYYIDRGYRVDTWTGKESIVETVK